VTAEKGAEATVTFTGTGAIISGSYLPDGGKYDVYLDGKFDRTLDAFSDEAQRARGRVDLARIRVKERPAHGPIGSAGRAV
jgi:hypothetical protein